MQVFRKRRKSLSLVQVSVIGLTTALKIQQRGGYQVTIVAEHFPTDPKSIKYASHFAGAHHVSVAGSDIRQRNIDIETFNTMWELSSPKGAASGCFMRLPQTEYHREETNLDTLKLMPNFAAVPANALAPEAISGIKYDSVNTDAPIFLNYLLSQFLASGGAIVRGSILHINQIIEGGPAAFVSDPVTKYPLPDAVVVCLGLGARYLGGIEDKDVYPVRGQTVLLRAPWVKAGMSISGGKEKVWTYVIPRRSGDVIVGGTYDANDWYSLPRAETTRDILTRVLEICPEIAPEEVRTLREPVVEDVLPIIVEESCGFRPCRKGGVRLELEWMETPTKRTAMVHNYGHGGFGYTASYGSATVSLSLLESALSS
ncbi:hypothetical protein GALMADRAFT_256978 [Galerina marginata CBS 339.88]|uniref:FAD dependent oxidoreductase domain-containing protein n=1 Tax=Galerina marginata (strain CBS 339.88) TaxID=685588 RepID=A0A067SBV2_GALM3|nr:hypothetical protein GALMADRAFT_256978 [Galerina marginata CBS 339.88]